MQKTRQHVKAGALALGAAAVSLVTGLVLGLTSAGGAIAGDQARTTAGGIPHGYAQVDPRNPAHSQQVFLGQPLSDNAPIFPGDPPFRWQLWNCVEAHTSVPRCQHGSGYTLEQIQSLGTHTGTHISAPCHFHEGKTCLNRLAEKFFGLRPLLVINVKPLILARHGNGNFFITAGYIQNWLRRTGCRVRTTTTTTTSRASARPRRSGSGSTARSASARTPSAPTPPWTRTSARPPRSPPSGASPWKTWARGWRACGRAATGWNSTGRDWPVPPTTSSAAGSTSPAHGWAWTGGPCGNPHDQPPGGRRRRAGRPGGLAALAAERAAVHGRAVGAVDLSGVLGPGRTVGARFPGTLTLQGLTEFGLHLVRRGGLVPLVPGMFRPCRLTSHRGLLPWDGHRRSRARPAPRPSRCVR